MCGAAVPVHMASPFSFFCAFSLAPFPHLRLARRLIPINGRKRVALRSRRSFLTFFLFGFMAAHPAQWPLGHSVGRVPVADLECRFSPGSLRFAISVCRDGDWCRTLFPFYHPRQGEYQTSPLVSLEVSPGAVFGRDYCAPRWVNNGFSFFPLLPSCSHVGAAVLL